MKKTFKWTLIGFGGFVLLVICLVAITPSAPSTSSTDSTLTPSDTNSTDSSSTDSSSTDSSSTDSSSTDSSSTDSSSTDSSSTDSSSTDSSSTDSSSTDPTTTDTTPGEQVTLANFYKIHNGMTLDQVEAILGSGTMVSEAGGGTDYHIEMYSWQPAGGLGASCNVTFTNGKVDAKAQMGLQ